MAPVFVQESDRLEVLLSPPRGAEFDFAGFLQAIFDKKYCGSFTVHCDHGIPRVIELPAPRLRLSE